MTVAARRNGLLMTPKKTHANLHTMRLSFCCVPFFGSRNHINLVTSLSESWSPTCRKAFSMSLTMATFRIRNRKSRPTKSASLTGPRYNHSLRLESPFLDLLDAPYTILSLVVALNAERSGGVCNEPSHCPTCMVQACMCRLV